MIQKATSLDQVSDASKNTPKQLLVLYFWSSKVDSCAHMNEVFALLASTNASVSFWDVDADSIGDLTLHFQVEAVPTFVLLKNAAEVARVVGANPEELAENIGKYQVDDQERLSKRLDELINRHPFMIFIKGSPEAPRCGFTRQLVSLVKEQNIDFKSFDILQDEQVRQGLKDYSNWPTYPQIYVKGEFMGGLDVFREMLENNDTPWKEANNC